MGDLLDSTTRALQQTVNMRQIRNNVTASNIANAETPGYKAKKVDFEAEMKRALNNEGLQSQRSDLGPGGAADLIGRVKADIYENPDGPVTNDGNTVDLAAEMSNLAENSIMYKAAIQLINKKMAALKYAATDGGR